MSTEDKDLGLEKIIKEMRKLGKLAVKVGIQDDGALHDKGGESIAQTAYWNEYGKGRIPSRPAHRNAFDDNEASLTKLSARLVAGVQDGKIDAEGAAKILGETHEGNVKKSIRDLKTPENKDSTKDAKGSSNPLIDTDQTIMSVRYVVEGG